MNENETNLRKRLVHVGGWSKWAEEMRDATRDLDALLAEHRAEVERLTAKMDEIAHHSSVGEGIARDAALEEAAVLTDERLDAYPSALGNDIRALKSRPAQVVPVAKVREVLAKDATPLLAPAHLSLSEASAWADGHAYSRRTAAADLGIDLDAPPKRDEAELAGLEHPSPQNGVVSACRRCGHALVGHIAAFGTRACSVIGCRCAHLIVSVSP